MYKAPKLQEKTPAGSLIPYSMVNLKHGEIQREPFRFNNIPKWGSYNALAQDAPGNDPIQLNDDGMIDKKYLFLDT